MPSKQLEFVVRHPNPPPIPNPASETFLIEAAKYAAIAALFLAQRFIIRYYLFGQFQRSAPVLTGVLKASLGDIRFIATSVFSTVYIVHGIYYTPYVRRYQNWRRSGNNRSSSADFFSRSFHQTQRYIVLQGYVSHISFQRR